MHKDSLRQKALDIIANPEKLDEIWNHLANGGNMIELCNSWKVRYCDIVMPLNKDPELKKLYLAALDARNEYAIQRILAELNALAFVDIRKLYDDKNRLLPVNQWPDEIAKAVSGIDVHEEFNSDDDGTAKSGETKKVKLYDKLKSIELLGKDLGRFISKHEVTGRLTLEDLVTGSNKEP